MPPFKYLLPLIAATALAGCTISPTRVSAPAGLSEEERSAMSLADLGVSVAARDDREFSFTDKRSGYFYARTHEEVNQSWFGGWNVATRRIVKDYALSVDGRPLARGEADVRVYPDRVERRFGAALETLSLVDGEPIIAIGLTGIKGSRIGISITGDLADPVSGDGASGEVPGLWLAPREDAGAHVLVAPWRLVAAEVGAGGHLTAPVGAGGFVLVHGRSREEAMTRLDRFRAEGETLLAARRARMENLLTSAGAQVSADAELDRALAWLVQTGDQLVTRQFGTGIYAGLPWFNDYWGRDTFIAMPGLTLVTGQFGAAREVLTSFARLQNTDPASRYFGRVPNRARPDDIIYNTTDGTPRFVSAVLDYVNYSGDLSVVADLYPAVKRATDAALSNWTDPAGYLTHEDADTWMDAKEMGTRPFSPRGDRANDIQALWHGQLLAAAEMADAVGDIASAARWRKNAAGIEARFAADFIDPSTGRMADHLDADGARDMKMRPNQFFALHLIGDPDRRRSLLKQGWQALVYPWGVASLSQDDPDFHPWHEHWNYYHKDAAYHNGTVWQWLNGIAMQRLIEQDQPDAAWPLFAAMNRQTLQEGAVGAMAENADALPRPGATWAKLSGTFLQAWSNAEQLRVWHQHFLGVQPAMLRNRIDVRPNLPSAVPTVTAALRIGAGRLHLDYRAVEGLYRLRADGIAPTLSFSLPGYTPVKVDIADGGTLEVRRTGTRLVVRVADAGGRELQAFSHEADPSELAALAARGALFRDLRFAEPRLAPDLRSLGVYHDPPLSY